MAGTAYKTQLMPGTDTELVFVMFSGMEKADDFEEPFFIISEDVSPSKAVHKAMKAAAEWKKLPMREERVMPEMLKKVVI